MKICCKDFRDLMEHIDDYPSLTFEPNIDSEDNVIFELAFIQKNEYGQSWHYLKYCPFCSKELKRND